MHEFAAAVLAGRLGSQWCRTIGRGSVPPLDGRRARHKTWPNPAAGQQVGASWLQSQQVVVGATMTCSTDHRSPHFNGRPACLTLRCTSNTV